MTKLNLEKRMEIRLLHRLRSTSRSALARQFSVSWQTIDRVLSGERTERRPPRRTSPAVAKRRKLVAGLASKVVRVGGRVYPKCPAVGHIRTALISHGFVVSDCTVRRDLRSLGLSAYVRRKIPTREPRVLRDRVNFCKKWMQKPTHGVVFSDEHTCSVNDHTTRTMWAPSLNYVLPRERRRLQNVPRIMVWAAVGIGFKSELVIFPQMTGSNSFRLDSKGYVRRCLARVVPRLTNRIFQQDGARPHVSAHTKRYLRSKNIELMENWPPYSPDLNCSELVWPILNRRIAEQHPQTLDDLILAAQNAWTSITQAEIDEICSDFPRRLRLVASGSGHTL